MINVPTINTESKVSQRTPLGLETEYIPISRNLSCTSGTIISLAAVLVVNIIGLAILFFK